MELRQSQRFEATATRGLKTGRRRNGDARKEDPICGLARIQVEPAKVGIDPCGKYDRRKIDVAVIDHLEKLSLKKI